MNFLRLRDRFEELSGNIVTTTHLIAEFGEHWVQYVASSFSEAVMF